MRKIIIEIETDSEESIGTLKNDLETEISCCWNSFDAESMKVFEAIGTNEEAIRGLENESCYECTWGCESPIKCTCPKCSLKDATQKAIEALRERPHGTCKTCKHYIPYKEQFSYRNRGDGYCKSTITTSEGNAYINCRDEWYCANYEKEGEAE